jgi:hypothetical protein
MFPFATTRKIVVESYVVEISRHIDVPDICVVVVVVVVNK